MRYLSVSAAVLGAATTFSFIPLDRTARASDHKPVVISIPERNEIVPSSGLPSTIPFNIQRYITPPTLLGGLASVDPVTCTEIDIGSWTNTADQNCGKDASGNPIQCGAITTGTVTGTAGGGVCAGHTFTFATIYYEWTAHNNQSTLTAPPNMVADTFDATWTGKRSPTQQYTFNINVPVVRPDHEETAFDHWFHAYGFWKQTLVPPSSDLKFNFSGEFVHEFAAPPAGPDTCWFSRSVFPPFESVTDLPNSEPATVDPGNTFGDKIGYGFRELAYYRRFSPTFRQFATCRTRFGQLMEIHAPSDGPPPFTTYTPYGSTNTGDLNALGASMECYRLTSIRAGMTEPGVFPTGTCL